MRKSANLVIAAAMIALALSSFAPIARAGQLKPDDPNAPGNPIDGQDPFTPQLLGDPNEPTGGLDVIRSRTMSLRWPSSATSLEILLGAVDPNGTWSLRLLVGLTRSARGH